MRTRNAIIIALFAAMTAPATAQPDLPRFICPGNAKSCLQPPADRQVVPPPQICRSSGTVTGKCYWARGTFSVGADMAEVKLQSGKTLQVELVGVNRLESYFGPNGEGISALYQLCPARFPGPFNLTFDGVCINAARDPRAEPLPEELYRRLPQARARWDAFRKDHPERIASPGH